MSAPEPREAVIRDSFRRQALECEALGSPFMALLLDLLAEGLSADTPLGARVLSWEGGVSGREAALALRLAAGLHALVLTGQDEALMAAYPPARVKPVDLWSAVDAAMEAHEDLLMTWLDSPPQTNEVRRSAPLIAGARLIASTFGLPLVLSELGASAGANMLWDRIALHARGRRFGPAVAGLDLMPDWRGDMPADAGFAIVARAGVDLLPMDPLADRLRLLSYIWADQGERLIQTMAALDLAAAHAPAVEQGEAADWAEARLVQSFPGQVHVLYHTLAWQYFPETTRARILDALDSAGSRATMAAPLVHLYVEADARKPGAGIGMTIWPGAVSLDLGRADFHGRWVDWADPLA